MPTQETPAPNQLLSDASVASTPPVGMMETHGHGPLTDFTKAGPPTSLPGNTLTISQPSSSACEISDALPQPDRKSTRLNSSHLGTSYAVFCLEISGVVVRLQQELEASMKRVLCCFLPVIWWASGVSQDWVRGGTGLGVFFFRRAAAHFNPSSPHAQNSEL